jgi:hypothetical protein
MEQVENFDYLRCDVPYSYDKDLEEKLSRFQQMCETTRRMIKIKLESIYRLNFIR